MTHPFNDSELVILFETAKVAYDDSELFDLMVEKLDVSDEEMSRLQQKLQTFMIIGAR